ncbi:hypothetical protein [Desulfosporosinus meridiei]|uniref:Lipoprotein n=1 Tax=Desulfosporosinus meridiei (strain ATCC BAA-275 / DSM 13257 / KCTC 12902 / NCIMB 13706 / S10) TaxID=768704 RepID=J7IKE6_DESMD|nr:hypothetical protein [Desulfosporosinus meridiei]AFQ42242.1 hypothetical protein Desmer_0175 [Desulfosporosinus meridiei DSM 13257]
MRKLIYVLAVILMVLLIIGCNKTSPPVDLKISQHFTVISEDSSKYIGQITIQNNAIYELIPMSVTVQMRVKHKEGIDRVDSTPLQLVAKEIKSEKNKEYVYEVEIPKKVFAVYENTDNNNIEICTRGLFMDKDVVILDSFQSNTESLVKN